jgi:hypothetical protein
MKIILSESQYKRLNSYNNPGVNLIVNQVAGKNLEPLSEGWLNTLADIVGIFDPTGLVDIGNAISYWSQGKNTFALLTLVSAIPGVDWATKPFILGSKIVAGASETKILGWLVRTLNKWIGKVLDKIDKMLLSKIPLIKNFANAMRTFINVIDAANAIIHLINHDSKYNVYNVGDKSLAYSKKNICELISRFIDFNFIINDYSKDVDGRDYIVDYSRLEETGFRCSIKLEDEIENIINFYKGSFNASYRNG